ncbi:MAG TPA: hypothetical protein VGI66_03555 [Streptosporangiaceae bacterium]|jgi:hypothetical protein
MGWGSDARAAGREGGKGDRVTRTGRSRAQEQALKKLGSGGRGGAGAHRARTDANGKLRGVERNFWGEPKDPKLRAMEAKTVKNAKAAARAAKQAIKEGNKEGNSKGGGWW